MMIYNLVQIVLVNKVGLFGFVEPSIRDLDLRALKLGLL